VSERVKLEGKDLKHLPIDFESILLENVIEEILLS
jgi:hypothetical protein